MINIVESRGDRRRWRNRGWAVLGIALLLAAWWLGSTKSSAVILPSPYAVFEALGFLTDTGVLWDSVRISVFRISSGWLLGGLVGIPLGLALGFVKPLRLLIVPYIEGLRYIPPIAFVSLFVIWFGTGEASKIFLLFYTSVFFVTINTMAGVTSVAPGVIRAARSLGAKRHQILLHILLPESVPHIVTGLRLALANAFLTIVAAEMMAASSGLGYLIWSSRNYMLTDQVIATILVAGLLGILIDRVFHRSMRLVFSRFEFQR